MGKREKVSKHSQDKEPNNKKIVIIFLVIFLIIAVIVGIMLFGNFDNKDNTNTYIKTDMTISNEDKTDNTVNEVADAEIEDLQGNYEVLGVLKIDKINLEKNILDQTTDESLNLSVTKFYGPELNEVGNFCITGHNYKNLFGYLDNLELEDTFEITDKAKSRKITYKVYDKHIVNTDELDCLSQETDGKKEVTLITCTPGGITRLIIKAKEI